MKTPTTYLGLLVVGVCALPSANAQVDTPLINALSARQAAPTRAENVVDKAEVSGFEVAFTALSQKYQTAFVCESVPYQLTLSPATAATLQKTLSFTPALSRQDEVAAVALAYDYDAVFANDHTVRLSGVMIDLYKAATPEQKAAYAKGVRWGDMPADVQAKWAYSQFSLSLNVPLDNFRHIANRLNGVKKPNATVFKIASYANLLLPAYEGPFRSPQLPDRRLVFLSQDTKTTVGGGTMYTVPGHFDHGKIIDPPLDPTTPTNEERAAPPKPRPAYQKTLAQAAGDMNARIAKRGAGIEGVVHVDMPAAIDAKTVSLIGAEAYLSPLEEVKAIGDVYGLRGVLGPDGVATIALPKPLKDVDPTQLWLVSLRALPVPIVRALRGPSLHPDKAEPVFPLRADQINPAKGIPIFIEAAKRLRILVEPKLADGKILPLVEAPPECKDLIGMSSLVDVAGMFLGLDQPRAPLTSQIEAHANQTFKMFQDGDKITYQFIDGGFTGSSSFPIPAATPPQTPQ